MQYAGRENPFNRIRDLEAKIAEVEKERDAYEKTLKRIEQEDDTRLRAVEKERDALRAALEWYGENARLCRLIHSEGDKGRNALAEDGGNRARAALSDHQTEPEPSPMVQRVMERFHKRVAEVRAADPLSDHQTEGKP